MRICSGPGCLRAVADGVRFCHECKPTNAVIDDGIRENTTGYDDVLNKLKTNSRWQRLRKTIIQRDPICRRCDLAISEIVDHIVPAEVAVSQVRLAKRFPGDSAAGYFITSNLQGLCRRCHGLKTSEDKTHSGEWPDVLAKHDTSVKRTYSF